MKNNYWKANVIAFIRFQQLTNRVNVDSLTDTAWNLLLGSSHLVLLSDMIPKILIVLSKQYSPNFNAIIIIIWDVRVAFFAISQRWLIKNLFISLGTN